MTTSSCVYCEGPLTAAVRGLRDHRFGVEGEFDLAGCTQCQALISDPMPSATEIGEYYRNYYTHQKLKQPPGVLQKMWPLPKRRQAASDAQTFFQQQAGGRALEIGCGAGERMLALAAQGWEVTGQDVDSTAGRLVGDGAGTVHRAELADCGFEDGSFDLVAMAHVMEHVPEPARLMAESWRLVAPGGRLVIIGPNSTGFGRRVFGRHWTSYHAPFHLAIPGPTSMERMAARVGLPGGTSTVNVTHADVVVGTSAETALAEKGRSGPAWYAARLLLGVASQGIATPLHAVRPERGVEIVWEAVKLRSAAA